MLQNHFNLCQYKMLCCDSVQYRVVSQQGFFKTDRKGKDSVTMETAIGPAVSQGMLAAT